jgi:hypothetical protein
MVVSPEIIIHRRRAMNGRIGLFRRIFLSRRCLDA